MRHVLLLSNSTLFGRGYLDHAEVVLHEHLAGRATRVLFVPFALHDRASYTAKVRERFERLGFELHSIHEAGDARAMRDAVARAECVFIGGGNTFRLLKALCDAHLIEPLRERALAGMPYIGSSAGTNVATASIQTTNDMPIVYPPTFDALALVPFNINAHYLDPDSNSKHMGETRETRIREFHEMNERPVLGLREGAWLVVDGESCTLGGTTGARLFQRARDAVEYAPPTDLSFLMRA
ncbi:MAG: dipeptidase PepE [Planctomycetota bacterium]|nr:dipeptidase PepE [Planctomycetota bacterium]